MSRAPASPDGSGVQIRARAARHGWSRRHRAPPFELKPHAVYVAVVVKAHALTSLAVDQEEEGALLAPRPEEGGAQGRHEPGHAGQHLVHLRHVDGGAFREGSLDLRPRRPPLIAPLGRDLHGNARRGESVGLTKARSDGAPSRIARRKQAGGTTSWPRRSASRRSRREFRGTR